MTDTRLQRIIDRMLGVAFLLLAVGFVLFVTFWATGCAAGRLEDSGDIVAGFRIAQLPETAGQFAKAAADFLPPPFNYLAGGAVALLTGGGAAAAARARTKRDADAQRKAEDAAWDAAQLAAHKDRNLADAHYDLARVESAVGGPVAAAGGAGGVPAGAAGPSATA